MLKKAPFLKGRIYFPLEQVPSGYIIIGGIWSSLSYIIRLTRLVMRSKTWSFYSRFDLFTNIECIPLNRLPIIGYLSASALGTNPGQ